MSRDRDLVGLVGLDAAPAATVVPPCPVEGCGQAAVVQWQRRLTAEEAAAEGLAASEAATAVRAVLACGQHSLSLDLAAHVHTASCTAPDPAHLPGCGCTPEPIPASPSGDAPTVTLPTGWTVPASTWPRENS